MNEAEHNLPRESVQNDLRVEVASVRHEMWTLLVLMLVVSGAFTIYLTAQVKFAAKDLSEVRQLVDQGKNMDVFLQKLAEYGRTHPDFVPILTKHGITLNSTPAPTPAAPAKK